MPIALILFASAVMCIIAGFAGFQIIDEKHYNEVVLPGAMSAFADEISKHDAAAKDAAHFRYILLTERSFDPDCPYSCASENISQKADTVYLSIYNKVESRHVITHPLANVPKA